MGKQHGGKERWASRIGVILAVAGSAVGLGNFLRFPGQAAANGGGAFLLPYFISLLVLGIPLCWAEWTMGRFGGLRGFNSAPGIYSVIWRNPLAKYFGAFALMIPLVIYMYYVLIEAWCLGYAINYITGDLMLDTGGKVDQLIAAAPAEYADSLVKTQGLSLEAAQAQAAELTQEQRTTLGFGAFFNQFVGAGADGAVLQPGHRIWLMVLLGTFAFNFVLIYRGVSKGIETFCRYAMPMMVILALIVLVRVLSLPANPANPTEQNVIGGLGFMWNPQPEKLANFQTWLAASGQIFFSLSVGFGIIINYASYLRREDDVVLSGLTSSSMNEFFEVCLGGLITLPAAFIFLGLAAGSQGTFDLGFKAMPNVFAMMYGGRIFGFLWFFMLFIAAVTSSVSMLQPVIAFLEEGFGLKRHASAALLGLIAALGCGFVVWFSAGLNALDTFDFWVGTFFIFVLSMFQAVLYGWIFGIQRGEREAHQGAHIRIPRFVQYMLMYIVPVYLIVIFVGFCINNLPSSETPKFETDVVYVDQFNASEIPAKLVDEIRDEGLTLQQGHKLTADDGEESWTVRDENDIPKFILSSATRELALAVKQDGNVLLETDIKNSRLMIDALKSKKFPARLRVAVPTDNLTIPADAKVQPDGPNGPWKIVDNSGTVLVTIETVKRPPVEVLAVDQYNLGYAEKVTLNPTVLGSVAFLGVVLTFLLILVHIAGRRWQAEGRFDNLDKEIDAT